MNFVTNKNNLKVYIIFLHYLQQASSETESEKLGLKGKKEVVSCKLILVNVFPRWHTETT